MKVVATAVIVLSSLSTIASAVCCCYTFASRPCSYYADPVPWDLTRKCGETPCADDLWDNPTIIANRQTIDDEPGWRLVEEYPLPCTVKWYKKACAPNGDCVVNMPTRTLNVTYAWPDTTSTPCGG